MKAGDVFISDDGTMGVRWESLEYLELTFAVCETCAFRGGLCGISKVKGWTSLVAAAAKHDAGPRDSDRLVCRSGFFHKVGPMEIALRGVNEP